MGRALPPSQAASPLKQLALVVIDATAAVEIFLNGKQRDLVLDRIKGKQVIVPDTIDWDVFSILSYWAGSDKKKRRSAGVCWNIYSDWRRTKFYSASAVRTVPKAGDPPYLEYRLVDSDGKLMSAMLDREIMTDVIESSYLALTRICGGVALLSAKQCHKVLGAVHFQSTFV